MIEAAVSSCKNLGTLSVVRSNTFCVLSHQGIRYIKEEYTCNISFSAILINSMKKNVLYITVSHVSTTE